MSDTTTAETPVEEVATNDPHKHLALPRPEHREFIAIDPLKIKVLDCRALVERVDAGNVTEGGIILPMGADNQRQLTVMKVVSVGDGRTTDHGVHIDIRVKPGDYVIVGKFAGHQVGSSEKYKIINEVEILGVQEVE
jgi:chaperonin GroES